MRALSGMGQTLPGNIEALRGRSDPEAVKAVAREMESLFAYEMLKAMRATTGSSSGGLGNDAYGSMFDMELSRILAERGLGLTEMLTKNLAAGAAQPDEPPQREFHPDPDPPKAGMPEIRDLLPAADRARVSSAYGMRLDPVSGEHSFHHGIDIAAPEGTEVHPVRSGTVLFSGEQPGYGNVVIIDHGGGFTSKYAHNQINLTRPGEVVNAATVIARVGSTGKSTGPHIHFEVEYQGRKVDPGTLLAMR